MAHPEAAEPRQTRRVTSQPERSDVLSVGNVDFGLRSQQEKNKHEILKQQNFNLNHFILS